MKKYITLMSSDYVVRVSTILAFLFIFPTSNVAQSLYEMNRQKDGTILLIGIPVAIGGYALDASITPLTLQEISDLERKDIPQIDRFASYYYSESALNLSDILLYTCLASPLLLLSSHAVRSDFGIIYGMYAESMLFGMTLPFYGKGGVQRIRPYAYNSATPMDIKLRAEAKRSFFSGHASGAFTSTIFLSTVYSTYYPNSKWKPYIWTGSILLASTIGYLRIVGGAHFLTDVLVGAIVGSTIGYLVPKIHKMNTQNLESVMPTDSRHVSLISFQLAL